MSDNKEVVKVIVTMIVISGIAAALLALTYVPTQNQLKILQAEQQEEALRAILPDAVGGFEPVTGSELTDAGEPVVLYYRGVDSSGNVVGYAVKRDQVGAQGVIQLIAGVSSDYGSITGMQVMKHSETPGLGALIVTPEFQGQFVNLPVADVSLTKNGGKVDAITGATISSQAVVDALHGAVDYVSAQEG